MACSISILKKHGYDQQETNNQHFLITLRAGIAGMRIRIRILPPSHMIRNAPGSGISGVPAGQPKVQGSAEIPWTGIPMVFSFKHMTCPGILLFPLHPVRLHIIIGFYPVIALSHVVLCWMRLSESAVGLYGRYYRPPTPWIQVRSSPVVPGWKRNAAYIILLQVILRATTPENMQGSVSSRGLTPQTFFCSDDRPHPGSPCNGHGGFY